MVSFSTFDVPVERKAAYWASISREMLALVDISPKYPDHFDGRLNRLSLGPIMLTDVFCSAVRVRHTRQHISEMSKASYTLFMPLQSGFELSFGRKRNVRIGSGELCLVDQAQPYDLTHGDAVHTLFLDFPRRYLESALPDAKRVVGQVMRTDRATSRMLASFLRMLHSEVTRDDAEEFPYPFYQCLLNLVAGVCAPHLDTPKGRGIRSRAKAFRALIEASLTNPELRQADIARHFKVSTRYVRAALREEGIGFSSYVLNRRLELSKQLLTDPESRSATITDISFRAGFNNASHFGRAFKQRYGVSPRAYRRDR